MLSDVNAWFLPADYQNVHEASLTEQKCKQADLPYGFDGGMYILGKHVHNYGEEKPYMEYHRTYWFEPQICMLCELLQSLLSSHFHWETLGKICGLEGYNEKPPKCLGGDKGLTKSINILVNLTNPVHYDGNDDGIGIGVWFEKDKTFCTELYFVMPNILVDDGGGVMQKGLVIKLKDGCVISYGTNTCHYTSMRISPNSPQERHPLRKYDKWVQKLDIFGFHFLILLEI